MGTAYIDIYCERTGPEFWAEPLNAASNLAFILAAAALAWRLRRGAARAAGWTLTGLIFVIGTGSFLFHTLAVRWAMLADVVPIVLFILLYTWLALRRFAAAPAWGCSLGAAAVMGVAAAVPALTGFRGGAYVAALVALGVIGGYLAFRRHSAGAALLGAGGVFAVSLTLRTLDDPLCSTVSIGTHYGWHILNATVLYMVTRAMMRHGAPAPRG